MSVIYSSCAAWYQMTYGPQGPMSYRIWDLYTAHVCKMHTWAVYAKRIHCSCMHFEQYWSYNVYMISKLYMIIKYTDHILFILNPLSSGFSQNVQIRARSDRAFEFWTFVLLAGFRIWGLSTVHVCKMQLQNGLIVFYEYFQPFQGLDFVILLLSCEQITSIPAEKVHHVCIAICDNCSSYTVINVYYDIFRKYKLLFSCLFSEFLE